MDRTLLKNTAVWALATAGLSVILFLFLDRPVHSAVHNLRDTPWYSAAAAVSLLADHDLFNILLSIGFVWIGVGVLSRGLTPGLRTLFYCCLTVAVAMIVGESLKWLLGRYRPEMLINHGLYGFSWFAAKGDMHSFPSGHTFRFFSAMTSLSLIWPRARVWLLSLAALLGMCRVVVTRHFPSDVVAGAFIGIFCAVWVSRIMREFEPKP